MSYQLSSSILARVAWDSHQAYTADEKDLRMFLVEIPHIFSSGKKYERLRQVPRYASELDS
jgi:hypothetical protein